MNLDAGHLYSVYQCVNTKRLEDHSVLVKIATELKDKQPEIDRQTYAYRLALKFANFRNEKA